MNDTHTDRSSGVPVDWTILVAGIVALAIAFLAVVPGGIQSMGLNRSPENSETIVRHYRF